MGRVSRASSGSFAGGFSAAALEAVAGLELDAAREAEAAVEALGSGDVDEWTEVAAAFHEALQDGWTPAGISEEDAVAALSFVLSSGELEGPQKAARMGILKAASVVIRSHIPCAPANQKRDDVGVFLREALLDSVTVDAAVVGAVPARYYLPWSSLRLVALLPLSEAETSQWSVRTTDAIARLSAQHAAAEGNGSKPANPQNTESPSSSSPAQQQQTRADALEQFATLQDTKQSTSETGGSRSARRRRARRRRDATSDTPAQSKATESMDKSTAELLENPWIVVEEDEVLGQELRSPSRPTNQRDAAASEPAVPPEPPKPLRTWQFTREGRPYALRNVVFHVRRESPADAALRWTHSRVLGHGENDEELRPVEDASAAALVTAFAGAEAGENADEAIGRFLAANLLDRAALHRSAVAAIGAVPERPSPTEVHCIVDNIPVSICGPDAHAIALTRWIESVDREIDAASLPSTSRHLFKRSLLLVETWLSLEAPALEAALPPLAPEDTSAPPAWGFSGHLHAPEETRAALLGDAPGRITSEMVAVMLAAVFADAGGRRYVSAAAASALAGDVEPPKDSPRPRIAITHPIHALVAFLDAFGGPVFGVGLLAATAEPVSETACPFHAPTRGWDEAELPTLSSSCITEHGVIPARSHAALLALRAAQARPAAAAAVDAAAALLGHDAAAASWCTEWSASLPTVLLRSFMAAADGGGGLPWTESFRSAARQEAEEARKAQEAKEAEEESKEEGTEAKDEAGHSETTNLVENLPQKTDQQPPKKDESSTNTDSDEEEDDAELEQGDYKAPEGAGPRVDAVPLTCRLGVPHAGVAPSLASFGPAACPLQVVSPVAPWRNLASCVTRETVRRFRRVLAVGRARCVLSVAAAVGAAEDASSSGMGNALDSATEALRLGLLGNVAMREKGTLSWRPDLKEHPMQHAASFSFTPFRPALATLTVQNWVPRSLLPRLEDVQDRRMSHLNLPESLRLRTRSRLESAGGESTSGSERAAPGDVGDAAEAVQRVADLQRGRAESVGFATAQRTLMAAADEHHELPSVVDISAAVSSPGTAVGSDMALVSSEIEVLPVAGLADGRRPHPLTPIPDFPADHPFLAYCRVAAHARSVLATVQQEQAERRQWNAGAPTPAGAHADWGGFQTTIAPPIAPDTPSQQKRTVLSDKDASLVRLLGELQARILSSIPVPDPLPLLAPWSRAMVLYDHPEFPTAALGQIFSASLGVDPTAALTHPSLAPLLAEAASGAIAARWPALLMDDGHEATEEEERKAQRSDAQEFFWWISHVRAPGFGALLFAAEHGSTSDLGVDCALVPPALLPRAADLRLDESPPALLVPVPSDSTPSRATESMKRSVRPRDSHPSCRHVDRIWDSASVRARKFLQAYHQQSLHSLSSSTAMPSSSSSPSHEGFAALVTPSSPPKSPVPFDDGPPTPSVGRGPSRRTDALDPLLGSDVLLNADLDFAGVLWTSVPAAAGVVALMTRVLRRKGTLSIAQLGKSLRSASGHEGLPGQVKDLFGGLKRLLTRYPSVFSIGNNHPFNPQVCLRDCAGVFAWISMSEDEAVALGIAAPSGKANKKKTPAPVDTTTEDSSSSPSKAVPPPQTPAGPPPAPPQISRKPMDKIPSPHTPVGPPPPGQPLLPTPPPSAAYPILPRAPVPGAPPSNPFVPHPPTTHPPN